MRPTSIGKALSSLLLGLQVLVLGISLAGANGPGAAAGGITSKANPDPTPVLPTVSMRVVQSDALSPPRNFGLGTPAVLLLTRDGVADKLLRVRLSLSPRPASPRFNLADDYGLLTEDTVQFDPGQVEAHVFMFYHFTESEEAPVRIRVNVAPGLGYSVEGESGMVHLHIIRPENRLPRVSVVVLDTMATSRTSFPTLTNPEFIEYQVTASDPDGHPKTARLLGTKSELVEFPTGQVGQSVTTFLRMNNPAAGLHSPSIVVTDDRGDSVTNGFYKVVWVEKKEQFSLQVSFPDLRQQAPTIARVQVDRLGSASLTNLYSVRVTGIGGQFQSVTPHRSDRAVIELPIEFPGVYTVAAPGTNLVFRVFAQDAFSEIRFHTNLMTYSRNGSGLISLLRVGPAETNCSVQLEFGRDVFASAPAPSLSPANGLVGIDFTVSNNLASFASGQREATVAVQFPESKELRGNRAVTLRIVGLTNTSAAIDAIPAKMIILENREIPPIRPRLRLVGLPRFNSAQIALEFDGDSRDARTSMVFDGAIKVFDGTGSPQQFTVRPTRSGAHRLVAQVTDKWQRTTKSPALESDVPLEVIVSPVDTPTEEPAAQLLILPSLTGVWIEASTNLMDWETILPLDGSSDYPSAGLHFLTVPRLDPGVTFYRTRRWVP